MNLCDLGKLLNLYFFICEIGIVSTSTYLSRLLQVLDVYMFNVEEFKKTKELGEGGNHILFLLISNTDFVFNHKYRQQTQ